MSAFKEPSPRWNHYAVSFASDGKMYMVGGRDESGTSMSLSTVEIFDPYLEVWEQPRPTTGEPPPPGLSGVGYTSAYDSTCKLQRLYMYGGFNGESWSSKLHCLDMVKFCWNEVKIWSASEFERYRSKPMPKAGCGLTALCRSQLACFGGYGVLQGDKQKGSKFTPDSCNKNRRGWTNEFHLLKYESGKLYSESHDMTGSPPPPCAYCSFTSVGLFRAVLFGGYQPDEQHVTDAVYFVDIRDKQWSPLEKSADKPEWPVGRSLHAACCINYREFFDLETDPQDRPQLLISGGSNSYDGTNSYGSTRSDVWMLDIASEVWKELEVNPQYSVQTCSGRFWNQLGLNPGFKEPSPQPRCLHTMTTINTEQAPQFLNVIMFGGCCTEYTANVFFENEHEKSVADTTMLHFMLDWSSRSAHEVATPTRDLWVLTHVETASETKFGSSTRIRDRILSLTQRATRALNDSDKCRERERDAYRMFQSANEKVKETEEKLRATEQVYQELKATQTITQPSMEVEGFDEAPAPKRKKEDPKDTHWKGGSQSSAVATILKKGDKPSLLILKKFPGKHGEFNVLERIGKNYNDFGTFLLKDNDGSKVSAFEASRLHNPRLICQDIMMEWLQGKGKNPVTYTTLVDCLRDADLNTLAKDIDEVLC